MRCFAFAISSESLAGRFLCLLERLRIHETRNIFFHHVHDEDSAHHTTVTEGGTTVKPSEARISNDLFTCLEEVTIDLAFDITLHTRFDGIKRMCHVASKQSSKQGCRNASLVVGVKRIRIAFHQGATDDWWNTQISACPKSFSDCRPDKATSNIHRILHDICNTSSSTTTLTLLLNHDQLQGRSDQRTHCSRADSRGHLFVQRQLAFLATRNHRLQSATNGKLDHCAGSHVKTICSNATVHHRGVHGNRSLLLNHILRIVEWLKDQHLDHTDGHSDRRILLLIQF
mmetsp:Transcript_90083/g.259689  ORF Transcript_90083/g.259689 Transcript_90083/m.259689 type:complete len:286 (-) Transcript_90083:162-1019(-)